MHLAKQKIWAKRILKASLFFGLGIVILIILANYRIENVTKNSTYNQVDNIPKHKVGLVLGTSKLLKDGRNNLYFDYRIQAATELFKSGKVDYLLISGDNGNRYYNEPQDMKNDLIKNGIPAEKIFLDYAGFRTLDSVLRAKLVFGQESFIVISQEFHNKRAIYIARKFGIQVIGYNAKDVNVIQGFKIKLREKISRFKVFLDIVLGVKPKYLGEKIEII